MCPKSPASLVPLSSPSKCPSFSINPWPRSANDLTFYFTKEIEANRQQLPQLPAPSSTFLSAPTSILTSLPHFSVEVMSLLLAKTNPTTCDLDSIPSRSLRDVLHQSSMLLYLQPLTVHGLSPLPSTDKNALIASNSNTDTHARTHTHAHTHAHTHTHSLTLPVFSSSYCKTFSSFSAKLLKTCLPSDFKGNTHSF